MSAEVFIGMIEEMIEIKVQQHAEMRLKTNAEVTKVLQEKRETDRRRLQQIKSELARLLGN
ncbi:MAG TPA: hypothetical protein VFM25_15530 [Verrucomicrobiae bacterium]|jgi:hypothetical protein|nr:hypothetical protein [Verrucomicrobiae bacterium]